MPATLTRVPVKGLIARFTPPRQAAGRPPKARQAPRAPAAVCNRDQPATQRAAPAIMPPAGRARPAAPVTNLHGRYPVLREIARLEALAMQAAWEQAARNDKANSERTEFRFLAATREVRSVVAGPQGT
ncbi:hypothetical protein GCM10027214_15900 [Stenotrophomonas tumulicola]